MKLEVEINKTRFIVLLIGIFVLSGAIVAYAYTSTFNRDASKAVVFGHSADEMVVKMNDGTLKTVEDLLKGGVGGAGNSLYQCGNSLDTAHFTEKDSQNNLYGVLPIPASCELNTGCVIRIIRYRNSNRNQMDDAGEGMPVSDIRYHQDRSSAAWYSQYFYYPDATLVTNQTYYKEYILDHDPTFIRRFGVNGDTNAEIIYKSAGYDCPTYGGIAISDDPGLVRGSNPKVTVPGSEDLDGTHLWKVKQCGDRHITDYMISVCTA